MLEQVIAEQMSTVLGVSGVSADDDFFDLGGDSVAAAELMVRLCERLGVSLPVSVLLEAPSAGALAEHVGRTEGATWGPLVPLRAQGSGRPLFLVHAIGGGVMFLSRLAARLEGRPIFGLQAPGFDGREPPLSDVQRLAAHYLLAVRRLQPQGPYLLGGFCMGSAVALEMARQLEQTGQQVSLLVLLDPPPLPLGARRRRLDRLKIALSALSNRLRGHEPGPTISPAEAPVRRANRRALRRYRPHPVQAPFVLFLAEQGSPEPAAEAEHALRRLTRGGVRVERIGAGHLGLFQEPAVDAVAARIGALLASLGAGAVDASAC
jgi:thioesterase domain-containing protein/acyl carrier protein